MRSACVSEQLVVLQQRRHASEVAEVVGILTAREAGTGLRLDREEARGATAAELLAQEGEAETVLERAAVLTNLKPHISARQAQSAVEEVDALMHDAEPIRVG